MERGSHARIAHISRWEAGVVFLAFILHAAAFTLYTGQIWEDYFITFRFSQNLAEGRGLTHNGVDRVHGFTSPLGTLLPAAFHWALRATSYEPALIAFRVVSIVAYASAATILFVFLSRHHRYGRLTAWLFALLFLFDAKSVAFSTNGMETGFMLLFTALGFVLSQSSGPRVWLATGAVWAGLLWARPDGCIYIAVFALLQLLQSEGTLRVRIRTIAQQSALTAILYLPWFLFAWSYFGSPVPHTIVAKAIHLPQAEQSLSVVQEKWLHPRYDSVYGPIGYDLGYDDWMPGLKMLVAGLAAAASLVWLMPFVDHAGRQASLASFLLLLYLLTVPAYSWYFPPVAMLNLMALASLFGSLVTFRTAGLRGTVAVVLLLVLFLLLYVDAQTFRQSKLQQERIEWGNRKPLADWLREHGTPGDTVYLECLGYIGFFSGMEMRDYPGLASPEVVDAWKTNLASGSFEHAYSAAFWKVNPTWFVARPFEAEAIRLYHPDFDEHYRLDAEFTVKSEIQDMRPFPGAAWLLFDSTFLVYRRIDSNSSRKAQEP